MMEEIKELREENKRVESQLFENRREFLEIQKKFEILKEIEEKFGQKISKLTEK